MEDYKEIIIESTSSNILVREGEYLMVTNGACYIQNSVLRIVVEDNAVITIPKREYESMRIRTVSGDCEINIKDSKINEVLFYTESGNLILDEYLENLAFSTSRGGCYLKVKGEDYVLHKRR